MLPRIAYFIIVSCLLSGTARSDEFQHIVNSIIGVKRHFHDRKEPNSSESPSIERVADELDYLEHQIETYGSIVPKQPDIWGEARLTRQRHQYELELSKRFDENKFDQTIQGSIRRADLAFLAASLAISPNSVPLEAVRETTEGDKIITPSGLQALSASPSDSLLSAQDSSQTLSLEPVVEVAQLSRYLNYLNQLRRINEGGDTADAPGYSLNMVRLPISVLPGKRTRQGYGAEITFTAEPYLSDDLLPSTVENLVINDLLDEFTEPMARFANNDPEFTTLLVRYYREVAARSSHWDYIFDQYVIYLQLEGQDAAAEYLMSYRDYIRGRLFGIALMAKYGELRNREANGEAGLIPREIAEYLNDVNDSLVLPLVKHFPDNVPGLNSAAAKYNLRIEIPYNEIANLLDATFDQSQKEWGETRSYGSFFGRIPTKHVTPVLVVGEENGVTKRYRAHLEMMLTFDYANLYSESLFQSDNAAMPVYPIRFCGRLVSIDPNTPTEVGKAAGLDAKGISNPMRRTTAINVSFQEADEASSWRKFLLEKEKLLKDIAQYSNLQGFTENLQDLVKVDFAQFTLDELIEYLEVFIEGTKTKDSESTSNLLEGYNSEVSLNLDQVAPALPEAFRNAGNVVPVRTQTAQRPVPPSLFVEVFGNIYLLDGATEAFQVLRVQPANDPLIHAFDIRQYFKEELKAAHDLLKTPQYDVLWNHCNAELLNAIRSADTGRISILRYRFHRDFLLAMEQQRLNQGPVGELQEGLAWAIIVDSALVDDHLARDMRQVAQIRGCGCLVPDGVSFVMPNSRLTQEAIETFKQYVACKWPIHVFTLDPITDDQNIDDFFDRRRELQLALAAGIASGEVSARTAMNFQRQMETEIETIALNRRIVSFSHGNDTFGWRFYPRVQTPDTPSNLVAFGQSLFGGPSRDSDIRQRELEPEMRECTAIVIMPSFVPTLTIESRANWFSLTNPRCKELTMNDTMKMSRTYQSIRNCMHTVQNNGYYRQTDVAQLGSVLDQMEDRLPLQQQLVGIPHENTLGAFDLFDSGITSLGPELTGWYGAPGIDPNGGTTLYLTGRRFSVLDSSLIVGGRHTPFKLISREVMEISVPPGVQTLANPKYGHLVDVHLATPYGPSSHQLIPVNRRTFTAGDRFLWATSNLKVNLFYKVETGKDTSRYIQSSAPPILQMRTPTLATGDSIKLNLSVKGDNRLLNADEVTAQLDLRTQQYVVGGANFQKFADVILKAVDATFLAKAPTPDQKLYLSVDAAISAGEHLDMIPTPMSIEVTLKPLP